MSATTIRARWYSVDALGMATLCRDEADAIQTAADCSIQWPNLAPHKAVQLGDVSALWAQHARDSAEMRRLCQARDDETRARKAAEGLASELLSELKTCRNDLARQAAELRQSVTVPGTETILDDEDETLCEFEESRIARLDALIARAQVA